MAVRESGRERPVWEAFKAPDRAQLSRYRKALEYVDGLEEFSFEAFQHANELAGDVLSAEQLRHLWEQSAKTFAGAEGLRQMFRENLRKHIEPPHEAEEKAPTRPKPVPAAPARAGGPSWLKANRRTLVLAALALVLAGAAYVVLQPGEKAAEPGKKPGQGQAGSGTGALPSAPPPIELLEPGTIVLHEQVRGVGRLPGFGPELELTGLVLDRQRETRGAQHLSVVQMQLTGTATLEAPVFELGKLMRYAPPFADVVTNATTGTYQTGPVGTRFDFEILVRYRPERPADVPRQSEGGAAPAAPRPARDTASILQALRALGKQMGGELAIGEVEKAPIVKGSGGTVSMGTAHGVDVTVKGDFERLATLVQQIAAEFGQESIGRISARKDPAGGHRGKVRVKWTTFEPPPE
ncbi:MAG: hypothetical protein JXR37_00895 [Kiritimatiellae bacterium]|nr:hypothetical protein [Kiritimatiellia bacterium]